MFYDVSDFFEVAEHHHHVIEYDIALPEAVSAAGAFYARLGVHRYRAALSGPGPPAMSPGPPRRRQLSLVTWLGAASASIVGGSVSPLLNIARA